MAPRLAAVCVVLALAGCGGGGASAEEEWAGDVCTAVSGWQDQVEKATNEAREALQSPGCEARRTGSRRRLEV